MSSFEAVPRPSAPAGVPGGVRQFAADFTGVLTGLDKTLRPDALILDPHLSYSLGPVALGDNSQGPVSWAWRLRYDVPTGNFYVARENDARTAWGGETFLFNTAVAVDEIDLAFEQAGRAVVCIGSAGVVRLYFYDATVPGFVLRLLSNGRTPRVILDNPETPAESDVLLCYLNPDTDRLELRQQRDRYATVYDGALAGVASLYLEEAVITRDNRVRLVYSSHDAGAGTYSLFFHDSTLYPFVLRPEDGIRPAQPVVVDTSTLRVPIIDVALTPEDGVSPQQPVVLESSTFGLPLIEVILTPEDGFSPGQPVALESSTFGEPLIFRMLTPEDAFTPAAPAVLVSSYLESPLINVVPPAEDAFRPAAPAVLSTSTFG